MSGAIQPAKPTTLKRYFIGFSTQTSHSNGVRSLYDIDLINLDLANAFNTRVGERVMRPDYGCKLWDYLLEPLTAAMRDNIVREATRVCELDTRLVIQNVQVLQVDAGFRVALTLLYLPWQVVSTFTANFESADQLYFATSAGSLAIGN